MKILSENSLTYLIQKIKASFFSKSDAESVAELSIDTTPTASSNNLITSGGVAEAFSSTVVSGKAPIYNSDGQLISNSTLDAGEPYVVATTRELEPLVPNGGSTAPDGSSVTYFDGESVYTSNMLNYSAMPEPLVTFNGKLLRYIGSSDTNYTPWAYYTRKTDTWVPVKCDARKLITPTSDTVSIFVIPNTSYFIDSNISALSLDLSGFISTANTGDDFYIIVPYSQAIQITWTGSVIFPWGRPEGFTRASGIIEIHGAWTKEDGVSSCKIIWAEGEH